MCESTSTSAVCVLWCPARKSQRELSVDVCYFFDAGFNDIVNETFKVGANAHNPAMLRVELQRKLCFNHNEYILSVFHFQHLVASAVTEACIFSKTYLTNKQDWISLFSWFDALH